MLTCVKPCPSVETSEPERFLACAIQRKRLQRVASIFKSRVFTSTSRYSHLALAIPFFDSISTTPNTIRSVTALAPNSDPPGRRDPTQDPFHHQENCLIFQILRRSRGRLTLQEVPSSIRSRAVQNLSKP